MASNKSNRKYLRENTDIIRSGEEIIQMPRKDRYLRSVNVILKNEAYPKKNTS